MNFINGFVRKDAQDVEINLCSWFLTSFGDETYFHLSSDLVNENEKKNM